MNCTTAVRVRYKETDQMGVVYYGNYFTWFEVGRNDFFRNLNLGCKELEEKGVLLPVIETGCKYISSAKFDEEILIETQLTELKGVRMKLNYKIYRKEDKALLAEGFTRHAFVDKNLRPIRFKKEFKNVWDKLNNMIKKEE